MGRRRETGDESFLLDRVKKDIEAYGLIEKGWSIVVGVSGGADSIGLLFILKTLAKEMELAITAVHVHHGLRGAEADGDAALVQELCDRWKIPLEIHYADVRAIAQQRGISLEEAGREERYRIFKHVLKKNGAQVIAVAHQREDQAETVMLNLLRGTGIDGLCGMEMKQGHIIRPLLHISRKEILSFLKAQGIDYRVDSSNLSSDYTRNRIRNELFPSIESMFAVNIHEQLVRLSSLARDDRVFLDQAANEAYEKCLINDQAALEADSVILSVEKLKNCHPALIKRIIRLAWERINTNRKHLEWIHVSKILELMDKETGKKLNLPCQVVAKVSYGKLMLQRYGKAQSPMPIGTGAYAYPILPEGITYAQEAGGFLKTEVLPAKEAYARYGKPDVIKEKGLVQLFDYDKLISGTTLRNRREGDRIYPRGSLGEKKLKEYFIDAKIPSEQRSSIPLVALDNRIVWAIGRRTSQVFRANEETRRVWVLSWNSDDGGENSNVKNQGFSQQR